MDDTPEPRPVNQSWDREAQSLHRGRWTLVIGMGIMVIAAIGILAYLVGRDNSRLSASCSFYRDVGSAQVPTNTSNHMPSKLGISIIVDSRAAYTREGCPLNRLPPPSPTLLHWASYYHIPVT